MSCDTDDVTEASGDLAVNDNAINAGLHGNNDNIAALPVTSVATPSGNITDSDDEIMATDEPSVKAEGGPVDDDWVMVERPSLTSDDQSLESMDSLTEECMDPIVSCDPVVSCDPMASCDPVSSLGAEEVITDSNNVSSVEQCIVTTTVLTSSSLPLDTSLQDMGGSIADDEAEDDEMGDWWRSKGPTTKPSAVTKPSTTSTNTQQPKWNSLRLTKQLKSRWGMPSSGTVTTTTAKEAQPTTVTSTKSGNLSAWFPEEEEKKELALPTAEEIAETKEREKQLAAAAAAKKEREKEKLLAKKEQLRKDSETSEMGVQENQQQNLDQPTSSNGMELLILEVLIASDSHLQTVPLLPTHMQ